MSVSEIIDIGLRNIPSQRKEKETSSLCQAFFTILSMI